MNYFRRTIESGSVVEVEVYESRRSASGKGRPRASNRSSTNPKQERRNWWGSFRRMVRKVNANFGKDDLFLVFTWPKGTHISCEEADKIFKSRFLTRVRRLRKKKKLCELKWYLRTEEKNGHIHHHLVMSGLPGVMLEELEALWPEGYINAEHLVPDEDYTELVKYLTKEQPQKKKYKRKWSCSRNLENPEKYARVEQISRLEFEKALQCKAQAGWRINEYVLETEGEGGVFAYLRKKKIGGLTAAQVRRRQAWARRKEYNARRQI